MRPLIHLGGISINTSYNTSYNKSVDSVGDVPLDRNAAQLSNQKAKGRKKTIVYLLFLMPGLSYLILNNYVPIAGMFIAFKNVSFSLGIFKSKWVGFKNFEFLFKSKDAAIILRNTLLYNLTFIIIGTSVAILVALLICELKESRLAKFSQTALLLPHLLSWIIIAYIVYGLLGVDTGLINNSILKPLGIRYVNWYSTPKMWPFILVIVHLWHHTGYQAIVYMSSMAGIDQAIYEAARIDGASRVKQITHITLPLIKPTVITMTLMAIGNIFYSSFGLFYQVPMDSGLLYNVTQTIDTYVYRALMNLGSIEMSAAAGVFQSVVGFIVVLAANALTRKVDADNALF